MHLSWNCPFSDKTNLHLELPGYGDFVGFLRNPQLLGPPNLLLWWGHATDVSGKCGACQSLSRMLFALDTREQRLVLFHHAIRTFSQTRKMESPQFGTPIGRPNSPNFPSLSLYMPPSLPPSLSNYYLGRCLQLAIGVMVLPLACAVFLHQVPGRFTCQSYHDARRTAIHRLRLAPPPGSPDSKNCQECQSGHFWHFIQHVSKKGKRYQNRGPSLVHFSRPLRNDWRPDIRLEPLEISHPFLVPLPHLSLFFWILGYRCLIARCPRICPWSKAQRILKLGMAHPQRQP